MGLLVDVGWGIATILVAVGGYSVTSALLLLYSPVPDDDAYAVVEDLVFVLTLPVVVAVVVLVARRS